MTYVKINGKRYPATINGRMTDREWNDRESAAITLEMTYEEAATTFVNGAKWSIIQEFDSYVDENGKTVTPEPVEYDNSEFCVAGSITDRRDGTVTVKMGKPTEVEALQAQLANAVTEEELEAAYVEGVNSL